MLRIYCDTNIYSLIKESHPSFNKELKKTLDELQHVLIFTYSFAHLEDKSRTKIEHIHLVKDDLEKMEEYVKDNYFYYDESDKKTHFYLATPIEAFSDFDFKTYNEILQNELDYSSVLGHYYGDEGELSKLCSSIMQSLMNMPMANPKNFILNENPQSKEWLDKIYPKDDNTTLGEMMNKMMEFGNQFLNDNSEIKKIRSFIGEHIKRDDYNFEKWGLEFDKRFSETQIKMSFSELMKESFALNPSYSTYDEFLIYYSCLELYNVTKEKNSGKAKSFNFRSLQNDAKHAWYASFSDYLVSDDKGLLMKSYIAYKYFKIPTKVFSVTEFVNMKNHFLNREEDIKTFSKTLNFEVTNGFVLKGKTFNDASNIIQPTHVFFNYFNRIKQDKASLTLFCERTAATNNLMFREVEVIVRKLIGFFGIDDDNKGFYDFKEEIRKNEDYFRVWTLDKLTICLRNGCVSTGTTLCLDLKLE